MQGDEIKYQGVFDREKVEEAVRRLGLRLKDRASLYLDAADRCQDDEAAEVLLELAQSHAERSGRIDEVRQQFDIPLTPIGDAKIYVNDYDTLTEAEKTKIAEWKVKIFNRLNNCMKRDEIKRHV